MKSCLSILSFTDYASGTENQPIFFSFHFFLFFFSLSPGCFLFLLPEMTGVMQSRPYTPLKSLWQLTKLNNDVFSLAVKSNGPLPYFLSWPFCFILSDWRIIAATLSSAWHDDPVMDVLTLASFFPASPADSLSSVSPWCWHPSSVSLAILSSFALIHLCGFSYQLLTEDSKIFNLALIPRQSSSLL